MIKYFDILLFYVDDFIKYCFILDMIFRFKYFGLNLCVVIVFENMFVKLKYYLICYIIWVVGIEEVFVIIVVFIKNVGILYYF